MNSSNSPLTPSDIVAEAANNLQIGILGKTTFDVTVEPGQLSSHECYVASEMLSEIILGLDWLLSNKVNVDFQE